MHMETVSMKPDHIHTLGHEGLRRNTRSTHTRDTFNQFGQPLDLWMFHRPDCQYERNKFPQDWTKSTRSCQILSPWGAGCWTRRYRMCVFWLECVNIAIALLQWGRDVNHLAIVLSTADIKPSMGSWPSIFPRATFQWISMMKPCNQATHETKQVAFARPWEIWRTCESIDAFVESECDDNTYEEIGSKLAHPLTHEPSLMSYPLPIK